MSILPAVSGRRQWPPFLASYVDDPSHGPLPALLLLLTALTGVIDAVSILTLGRVFVANMTGNVAFIAFGVARAPGFSLVASIAALIGFLLGALAGGRLVQRYADHRGLMLRNVSAAQLVLVVVSLITALSTHNAHGEAARSVIAVLLAAAMGLQNVLARRLAVPDLTTTVLTMTLTGIAADARTSRGATTIRRALAVLMLFGGAAIGAVIVLHTQTGWALGLAAALIATVAVLAACGSRRPAVWHTYGHTS